MKLEFSRQIFEKYADTKFYENPFSLEPRYSIRTDGLTDRHDETNRLFSQFCKSS